jgi:hypothetical protein
MKTYKYWVTALALTITITAANKWDAEHCIRYKLGLDDDTNLVCLEVTK